MIDLTRLPRLPSIARLRTLLAPMVLAVALAGPGGCASTPTAKIAEAAGSATYDATPLLASMRDASPSARTDLERAAGIARLEELSLYDLTVGIDIDAATFTLQEDVYFTNREDKPLDELVLRIYANVGKRDPSTALPVVFRSGKCVASSCDVKLEGKSVIAVRPRVALGKGEHLRVSLDFGGALETIDSGRTNLLAQGVEGMANMAGGEETAAQYGLLARGDGITSLGNFYPVVARRRDGAWDRAEGSTLGDVGPDEMSHVHARIDVPADAKVAVTGTIISETPKPGTTTKRVDVAAGLVRDFALLVSRDFEVATKDVDGVTVRSWFLKPERAAGERVLDVAATALATFEKRFGPYPYKDLDVVEAALVGGAGGVEFGALVTVASMMYRPAQAGPGAGPLEKMMSEMLSGPQGVGLAAMTGTMLEFTTAHEVAHQWWHGIVGSDSRVHPYVDESLAQFSAILYLEDRYGAARAKKDGDTNVRMNYQFMRMTGEEDAAVDRPASAMSKMAYGGLVYGKGPYFYEAARKALGDPAFFEIVRAYVTKFRFRLAPPEGFVDVAAAKEPKMRALAKHWFQESHGDDDLGKLDLGSMVGQMLGTPE